MGERVHANLLTINTNYEETLKRESMYIQNGYYGRNILGSFLLVLPDDEVNQVFKRFGDFRYGIFPFNDYEGTADTCLLNINNREYYGCVVCSLDFNINTDNYFIYKDYYINDNGLNCIQNKVISFREYIKVLENRFDIDVPMTNKQEFINYLRELVDRYQVQDFDHNLLDFFNKYTINRLDDCEF